MKIERIIGKEEGNRDMEDENKIETDLARMLEWATVEEVEQQRAAQLKQTKEEWRQSLRRLSPEERAQRHREVEDWLKKYS